MYKAYAMHLLAIAFVIYLAAAVIAALLALAGGTLGVILGSLVDIIAAFLLQATLVKAVQDVRDGRVDMSLGETVRAATPYLGSVALASVLAGIAITIGLILIIAPGLYLITIWAVIVPVIVIEGVGPLDSFGRSHQLVRGRGWHVFGTLVLVYVILLVVDIVLGLIFAALPHVLRSGLSSVISGTLIAPFIALVVTLVYYRLAGEAQAPAAPGESYGGYQQTPLPGTQGTRAACLVIPHRQAVAVEAAPGAPAGPGERAVLRPDRGGRGPVLLQVRHEIHRTLLREEQPRAVDGDHAGRAGDGVPQPVGPGDVEERVPGAPHHQGRHGELAELRRDRGQVTGVEGGQQPFELASAFHGPETRFQVGAEDGRVGPVQVLVGGPEGDLGGVAQVAEQRDGRRREFAGRRELDY